VVGFGSGLDSSVSIPTNGNDLASMLGGLGGAPAASAPLTAPPAVVGNLIDGHGGNLLADLNPNNVVVVGVPSSSACPLVNH